MTDRRNAKTKWFNPTKGFGFLIPEEGGKDVFIHISALEKAGIKTLADGQAVSYVLTLSKGKESATDIEIL